MKWAAMQWLTAMGVACSGCAMRNPSSRTEFKPVCFPDSDAVPRVVVLGSVGAILPEYDETSALERFLYGPNPAGKVVLRNPQGVALWQEFLLVCDQGFPDLVAIDLVTGKSRRWGDANHPPRCPVGLAVDSDQRVYVADTNFRSVLIYDANQRFVRELLPAAGRRTAFRPCAVCAHDGTLYIGNVGDHSLDRYTPASDTWLPAVAPPASSPPIVAPTGICVTPGGVVLVADAVQGVVHRFAPPDKWLPPIGSPGRGKGQFVRPKQVCCTSSGLIFVSDAGRQSVLVFSPGGDYLLEISGNGAGWDGFTLPMGLVAVHPDHLLPGGQSDSRQAPATMPAVNECVIVSDSLGGISLTVLGIVTSSASSLSTGGADAG